MKKKHLWHIFHEAYLGCPQARPFDYADYKTLSFTELVDYMLNPQQDDIMQGILWDKGYWRCLPPEIQNIVADWALKGIIETARQLKAL